jgi:hypothetical protein
MQQLNFFLASNPLGSGAPIRRGTPVRSRWSKRQQRSDQPRAVHPLAVVTAGQLADQQSGDEEPITATDRQGVRRSNGRPTCLVR